MRPHRLRFAGIGPYPQLVEIDFDDLSSLGLYLIVGPTGAGKTTIFDAITFALYGKVAGDRDVSTLVSDFAHREAPFVELDFSHRGRSYRVRRSPQVAGKPAKPSDIRFIEYDDDFATEHRRDTGTSAVTKAVAELIGLDADQFMKVMLLPQNEFQEFLMANSTDKEPLLRALFGTSLYLKIALRMVDSAKLLKEQADEKSAELSGLRGMISDAVENLLTAGMVDELPDPDEDLPALLAELGALVESASADQKNAETTAATAAEANTKGEAAAVRFDAAEELAGVAADDVRLKDAVATARTSLANDERARRVVAALGVRDEAAGELNDATRLLEDSRVELVETTRTPAGVVPVLTALRAAAPSASPSHLRREWTTATEKLDGARAALDDAGEKEHEAASFEAAAATAETSSAAAAAQMEGVQVQVATDRLALDEAKQAARILPELEQKVAALDVLLVEADVAGARTAMITAQVTHDKAKQALGAEVAKLEAARLARTRHLAGELAHTLTEGDPCPVCGSISHPKPAEGGPDTDVDTLETTRDRAHERFVADENELKAAQAQVVKAEAAGGRLPADEEQRSLRDHCAKAQEAFGQLDARDDAVTRGSEQLVALTKTRHDGTAKAADLRTRSAELHTAAAKLRTKSSAIVDPTLLENVADVLDGIDGIIDELEVATTQLTAATSHHKAMVTNAASTLKAESFATEQAATDAVLTDPVHEEAAELVADAEGRVRRALELRAVIGESPVPTNRPDLAELEAVQESTRLASRTAGHRATTLSNALAAIRKHRDKLAKLGPDVDRLVRRAARAKDIATIVHRGAKDVLPLERWVQRTVFEEVCDVATDQLRALSHGRYVLTLEANGQRSRTRAGGLDLFVTDGHTGVTRPVGSLSGGEKFLTSLALALALAEVVQNRSGGIELSTLFIDEGFGSLDGDTLETAVEVLRRLQDTGRTVGVISHVEAMRQELPVGLQVTPGQQGSTLKMGLAVTGAAA